MESRRWRSPGVMASDVAAGTGESVEVEAGWPQPSAASNIAPALSRTPVDTWGTKVSDEAGEADEGCTEGAPAGFRDRGRSARLRRSGPRLRRGMVLPTVAAVRFER